MSQTPIFEDDRVLVFMRTVGLFATNSFLVQCKETKKAALVDSCGEFEVLQEMVTEAGAELEFLLQTHAHLDHVGALKEMEEWVQKPIVLHQDEMELYNQIDLQCRMFGIPPLPQPPKPSMFVEEGDVIELGKLRITLWKTPGHTPGSLTFFVNDLAFVGDTLFQNSIGRTDLPGGDWPVMKKTLARMKELPGKTTVFPGHGPITTIARENDYNPFLQD